MNLEDATPMYQYYFKVQSEYPDYIVCMQLGDFYEIWEKNGWGGHAKKASQICDMKLTKRNTASKENNDVPDMCGFPTATREDYIKKMVDAGETVVVISQRIHGTRQEKNRNVTRYIEKIVSAGTVIDHLKEEKNNYFASLYCQEFAVGISLIDLSTGHVKITEISQDSLNDYLINVNPTEIIVFGKTKNQLPKQFKLVNYKNKEVLDIFSLSPASGETTSGTVYKTNDSKDRVRCVGSGVELGNNSNSLGGNSFIRLTDTTSYCEITFLGTGLNLLASLFTQANTTYNFVIDGITSGSIGNTVYSDMLDNKYMRPKQILNITKGLSFGYHTIKISNANAGYFKLYGFEILNEHNGLMITGGKYFREDIKDYFLKSNAIEPFVSQDVEGSTVSVLINSDGSISQVKNQAQTPSFLGNADNSNDLLVKNLFWTDFGELNGINPNDFNRTEIRNDTTYYLAYTMNDGQTVLVGNGVNKVNKWDLPVNYTEKDYGLRIVNNGKWIALTFVGTGLSIQKYMYPYTPNLLPLDPTRVFVDQIDVGWLNNQNQSDTNGGAGYFVEEEIVSGLPYGSHEVKFLFDGTDADDFGFTRFKIYKSKANISLNDNLLGVYERMPTYQKYPNGISTTTSSYDHSLTDLATNDLPSGVLRKSPLKGFVYVGSGFEQASNTEMYKTYAGDKTRFSYYIFNTTNSDNYAEYTFFGTGAELRLNCYHFSEENARITVDKDGNGTPLVIPLAYNPTWNGPALTSYNSTTGNADTRTDGDGNPKRCTLKFDGYDFGVHTIRVQHLSGNGAANLDVLGLDVIAPIDNVVSKTSIIEIP